MKLKYFLLAVTLGTASTLTKAQDYDLGFFVGTSVYQGDLSPGLSNGFVNALRGFRPAIGGLARYNFHPNFSVRGNLNVGYIAAYDRYGNKGTGRESRNLSFHSPLVELSAVAEVNLMKYIAGSRKYRFAPFLFAGVGVFYTEPQTYLNGTNYKLRKLATEQNKDYGPINLAIPVGLGIKYNYRDDLTFAAEFGFRKTFTDYIDDVSGRYSPTATLVTPSSSIDDQLSNRTDALVKQNGFRGNPGYKDAYLFIGVSIYKTIRPFSCRNF